MSNPIDPGECEWPVPLEDWRTCYRLPLRSHHPSFMFCDCMRTEIPIDCQAKSSGALAHPSSLRVKR